MVDCGTSAKTPFVLAPFGSVLGLAFGPSLSRSRTLILNFPVVVWLSCVVVGSPPQKKEEICQDAASAGPATFGSPPPRVRCYMIPCVLLLLLLWFMIVLVISTSIIIINISIMIMIIHISIIIMFSCSNCLFMCFFQKHIIISISMIVTGGVSGGQSGGTTCLTLPV